MTQQKFTPQFAKFYDMAIQLSASVEADALVVVVDGPTDWQKLKEKAGKTQVVVASDSAEHLMGAHEAGLDTVAVNLPDAPVFERLTQALLESVADDILVPGA